MSGNFEVLYYEVFHRIHYWKARLSEVHPDVENVTDATPHTLPVSCMFFLCPMLRNYLMNFFTTLSKILKIKVDICPSTVIFVVPARHQILLQWKSPKTTLYLSVAHQLHVFNQS